MTFPTVDIAPSDLNYIDQLYQQYQNAPNTVDPSWQRFFQGFEYALQNGAVPSENGQSTATVDQNAVPDEIKAAYLIEGYRKRGHLLSKTNPIRSRRDRRPRLEVEDYGLSSSQLEQRFYAGTLIGMENATLSEILDRLQVMYTRNIGIEYEHILNTEVRNWVRDEFEARARDFEIPQKDKRRILQKLNEAVVFENFLHTKYIGQKRFSLEGGENTIPALDAIVNKGARMGVQEVVIGMAHRGRLNVLANVLGKTYEYIFSEFEGQAMPEQSFGDGDVKYHLGFSSEIQTEDGHSVYLKMTPNPSHLEAVDPVVEGFARSKIDMLYEDNNDAVLPILIHGDAALAGQGVVYEVAQMSQLPGYHTGGTMHFVINNQLGFTTDFDEARTSEYCTSVGRVIGVPIIHVNGDDAESVLFAVQFATEFRQRFKRDVIVDMVCYRRHGHNEGDEPKFTQPKFYNLISKHPDPRKIYSETLVQRGEIDAQLAKDMEKEFKGLLQDRLNQVKQEPLPYHPQPLEKAWDHYRRAAEEDFEESPETGVDRATLEQVAQNLVYVPDHITPIRKVDKLIKDRAKQIEDGTALDWAMGELLAYGTLLLEGKNIRLSGQDTVRGTFSHRHATIFDAESNRGYTNLNHLASDQGRFRIYNSLLSEFGALGFEYGYSMTSPDVLTIWEAQFGDFANGAQVVFDQFISSGESKWQRMCGLVCLLPHGYEGQGPEHSSARLERFLQLAAELNMVIANCTVPANFYHLLRRQLHWPFRKPLIVFTPKSLLRHPRCKSPMDQFTAGRFREVIDDPKATPKKVKRVLLCTGKIYYDLLERQEKDQREDVAVVRIEQLYPLPKGQMEAIFERYPKAEICWVQEEPKNMGAWTYMLRWETNQRKMHLISRKSSASPATGFHSVHEQEQERIISEAFRF
jgi:2-oxoglutarate dehydrogenase E1 component